MIFQIWIFQLVLYNLFNMAEILLLAIKYKHYENTPIQMYWKFYNQKLANFQIKISNIFHISAQNIECGYSLEPPRWGGSNEYPQSIVF